MYTSCSCFLECRHDDMRNLVASSENPCCLYLSRTLWIPAGPVFSSTGVSVSCRLVVWGVFVSLADSKTCLSVSIVMSTGQNGWFFHAGATTTPLALSHFIFCSTLDRTLKGENNTLRNPPNALRNSLLCVPVGPLYMMHTVRTVCLFLRQTSQWLVVRPKWLACHEGALGPASILCQHAFLVTVYLPQHSRWQGCALHWSICPYFRTIAKFLGPSHLKAMILNPVQTANSGCAACHHSDMSVPLLFKSNSSLKKIAKSSR